MSASEIASEICPENLYGCPIADAGSLSSLPSTFADWVSGGFECVDVTADLEACGGCASLDIKHDCTLISGAESVSCMSGVCLVDSCLPSYKFDSDRSICISK
ncbi:hypothetical protein HYPSUDRAFT_129355 [Hypholoma sublateritium FD-334 SS-4]|uniref:Protein CPL1-like domain-containing protein n=1 Tax=Hypholoma sublateritium (strain FD-334 SS-4) TaxID=945553 RepID=A0A0D2LKZ0_HYPSF|nr:hypothetical protein HYPSUDRAFT_129355 [Hypholoma sublateritium FD-334 SS-4]